MTTFSHYLHYLLEHTIAAQVTDSNGSSDTDAITVNPSVQTSVTITSPQNNEQVSGKFIVNVGISGFERITTVSFKVDGNIVATDQSSPYDATLFAKNFSSGTHTLVVEANDTNNFNSDSIIFRVR